MGATAPNKFEGTVAAKKSHAAMIEQNRNSRLKRDDLTAAVKFPDEATLFDLLQESAVKKVFGVGAGRFGIVRNGDHRFNVVFGNVRHARKNTAKGLVSFVENRAVVSHQIARQGSLAGLGVLIGNLDGGDISAQVGLH